VEHIDPMTLQAALPANAALIPADALHAGTRLDNYEIDCVIARSAVAMVYRAQDRTSKQAVAIKEFLPTGLAMRGDDGQVVARDAAQEQTFDRGRRVFLEEAQALAKREHDCLMPVLRVLESHGTVYKVMPYCPGPTLLEHRQSMPAAPTDRMLRSWLEGLLGALAKLHDKGKVHGAVTPGNILMLASDRPLLLDSDAVYAAILSDRTRSMIAALEPCFAPQEQCEPAPERPLGPWTDLYGLAATMRFCVTGQLPGAFAQRSRGAWLESAQRPRARSDEPEGSDVPQWLKTLDACLADTAKDRPRSLAQLRRLLANASPTSPAAMESAAAGLAPMLSSPVPKSDAGADRPAQFSPEPARQGTVPDVQGTTPVVQPAAPGAAQLSLPPVLDGAAGTAHANQPDVDIATQPPEASRLPDAVPSISAGPATTAGAKTTVRSRRHLAWTVGLLAVAAIAAGTALMFNGQSRPGSSETKTSGPVQPTAPSIAQVRPVLEPVPASPGQPVARADASSVTGPDVPSATQVPRVAAPKPPLSRPASAKEPRKPVAAKEQSQPPSVAKARAGDLSPRQACAGKERYALLRCMETQCAKKAWTKHEQCVRLRKDRRL
jgi:serine/threonine protein kinase